MAEQGSEQNKSEEATPFKLRRAREKGQVARGMDLGFFGGLVALAAFLLIAGQALAGTLANLMRKSLTIGIDGAADPQRAAVLTAHLYWPTLQPLLLLGGTVLVIVAFLEVLQLRGIIFSTQPLKPDFSRINPAKGLKRLFSLRMLKEALKSILKMAAYSAVVVLAVKAAIAVPGRAGVDAQGLVGAMEAAGMKLLYVFILLALFFAVLDQIIARKEFGKQMRMSHREVTREAKEREGEPRMKQKRKQLHADFVKQAKGLGNLPGSDLLVVNPDHYAVALRYEPARMSAPEVTAKARNHHALALKRQAFRLGIPIFENPPLARALHASCEPGAPVAAELYAGVADLYVKLHQAKAAAPSAGKDDAQSDDR
jgi:flagellar biosynthesis protein FlhB